MNVVGIDGCKYGWISINLKDNLFWEVKLFHKIEVLLDSYKSSDLILIDMPVGLLDQSKVERTCDKEIRKILSHPRGMSVFVVPTRRAIYCDSYSEANALNKKLMNRGISKQLWGIAPKIKSLDQYLMKNKTLEKKLFESHPELAFMMLNGNPMKHNKRTHEGYSERFELLKKIYPRTNEIVNHTLEKYLRKEVKKDDILDALVLSINAYLGEKLNFKNYPESIINDDKGFQMTVRVLDYQEIEEMQYKEIRGIFK